MQLTKRTRLERHKCRGNGLADGEIGRVNLVKSATLAANLLGLVLKGAVDEGGVAVGVGVGHVHDVAVADGSVDDIRVGLGHVVKDGLVDAKVLGQDVLGRVGNPVVNVEGGSDQSARIPLYHAMKANYSPSLVKVAIIKDQEELGILGGVNRVGDTLGEVPDITVANLLSLVDAVLVDGRDNDFAGIQEAPFSLLVSDRIYM